MIASNIKCSLVLLLLAVTLVIVNADDTCMETCHVIYEVDNQTYRETYKNYRAMLSALPHHITSLELPERCDTGDTLKQKELQHFSKLQRLWLRFCDIKTDIYGSSFDGLDNLKELSLDYNLVSTMIDPKVFKPIQTLRTLRILPHTSLLNPPPYKIDVDAILRQLHNLTHFTLSTYTYQEFRIVFASDYQLPSVYSLDFSNNKWKVIPCLQGFPNLRQLNLSGNRIRNIIVWDKCFQTKHITIDLSNNIIRKIEKQDFKSYSMKSLSLDLSQTQLSQVDIDVFQHLHLQNTTIQKLTIGRDKNQFHDRSFLRNLFTSLQEVIIYRLVLFGNQILPDIRFLESKSMSHLSIHGNNLGERSGYVLFVLTNLTCLNLSYSPIEGIDDDSFRRLNKLKTFVLTGVKAGPIARVMLAMNLYHMPQLEKLIMNNMGKWLSAAGLGGLTNILTYLDFSDNYIQGNMKLYLNKAKIVKVNNIICECERQPCIRLEEHLQIERLEMKNSYSCVSPFTNQTVYSKLLNLDASQNANVSLDSSPLVNIQMPRLQFLNLSHNSVEQLSTKTFAKVLELRYIDLSFNKITTIRRQVFSRLTSLKKLKLNNNFISTIDAQNFKGLKHLKVLSLSQNRFDCNCELRQLRDWIQTKGLSEDMLDTCKYPTYLKQASIAKFQPNWIDCDGHIYIVIFTSVAGVILLIILLLALSYYRLDIKYWYFLKYKYRNLGDMENNMYDAMVCYHVDDLAWIRGNLMPQLEEGNEHQFRLCVHHRDFAVGQFIKQNIINSMNRSSSIIFVMTRKFMNSEWGQFELEMALMRLPEVKCQFVVMVMLEKIPKKELKAKLRCFTRHLTYIEWPLGDDVEQRERDHFWKKLILALMQNKQAPAVDENAPLLQDQ